MAQLDASKVLGMHGGQGPSAGKDLGEVAWVVGGDVDDDADGGAEVGRKTPARLISGCMLPAEPPTTIKGNWSIQAV